MKNQRSVILGISQGECHPQMEPMLSLHKFRDIHEHCSQDEVSWLIDFLNDFSSSSIFTPSFIHHPAAPFIPLHHPLHHSPANLP
jgi:hypothetical protein